MHILWNYEGGYVVTSALFFSLQYEPEVMLYY